MSPDGTDAADLAQRAGLGAWVTGYDAGVSQIDRHRITHVVVFVLLATFGAAGALLGGLGWVLTGLAVVGIAGSAASLGGVADAPVPNGARRLIRIPADQGVVVARWDDDDQHLAVIVSYPGCPPKPEGAVAELRVLLEQTLEQLGSGQVAEQLPTAAGEDYRIAITFLVTDDAFGPPVEQWLDTVAAQLGGSRVTRLQVHVVSRDMMEGNGTS